LGPNRRNTQPPRFEQFIDASGSLKGTAEAHNLDFAVNHLLKLCHVFKENYLKALTEPHP
jgi:hypothetical protein